MNAVAVVDRWNAASSQCSSTIRDWDRGHFESF
jgi:hypothetical protein